MNILVITTHLNFGGITSYVVNLAEGLVKNGHKVFVASSGGDLVGRLKKQGIEHINIDIKTKSEFSPKIIFAFFKLKKIIREKNIQVIHSQTRVTQVLSYLLSRVLSVPYVATCHGYFKPHLGRRIFGAWGNKVIAISRAVREHLINDFRVSADKVQLVYNGININSKRQYPVNEIKKRLGLSDGPVVGIVARLSIVKGHKYLIEAMKEVISRKPQAKLLIVGDGPLRDELLMLIKKNGISSNTLILPFTENIAEIFSVMSVYVSPSLQEGLGLSILEAQANYVPCVGFRVGGISDIIIHEANGLLVEPFDVSALASNILRLIQDNDLSLRLSGEAYKIVQQRFSLEEMAANTIKVYEDALNEKKR